MRWDQADIFLVPLLDGGYGLGQVFEVTGEAAEAPLCGLTAVKGPRDIAPRPLAMREFLAFRLLDPAHLADGTWPIIGFEQLPNWNGRRYLTTLMAEDDKTPLDPAVTEAFLNAAHGLYPWDGFPDPGFFDGLLHSGVARPEAAVFKAGA